MLTLYKSSRTLVVGTALATLLSTTSLLAAPYVYVPVGGAGQILVIDAETGKSVDTYTGLEAVHGLAGTPDGQLLIAGSYTERELGSGEPAKPQGVSAEDHAAHHAPKSAEAAATSDMMVSTVTILRQSTGEIIRAVDVPGAVHHVSVSPDGRYAVVTQPGNDAVTAIDLTTYEVVATVKSGSLPNYVVFSQASNTLYVSNAGDNTIAVIGMDDWQVRTSIATGESPEHMVLTQDGNTLFVNNNDDGSVGSIDLASGQMTESYKIGDRLHGLDLSEDGTALLVAERGGDRVARVDLASGVVSTVPMAPEPYHLTTIPGSGLAMVSSSDENALRIIRQDDLSLVQKIELPDVGHQMVVAQSR